MHFVSVTSCIVSGLSINPGNSTEERYTPRTQGTLYLKDMASQKTVMITTEFSRDDGRFSPSEPSSRPALQVQLDLEAAQTTEVDIEILVLSTLVGPQPTLILHVRAPEWFLDRHVPLPRNHRGCALGLGLVSSVSH